LGEHTVSDYDKRQYERMLLALPGHAPDQAELKPIVDSLLFLRDALEQPDVNWERPFLDHVLTLEDCYMAAGHQIEEMGDEFRRAIDDAIHQLRQRIQKQLDAVQQPEEEENRGRRERTGE
jgi:hypothetical protein